MNLFHHIRKFWEIPPVEKKLLFWALYLCLVTKTGRTILPVRIFFTLAAKQPAGDVKNRDIDRTKIRLAKKTMKRLEIIIPFQIDCLTKAIVLKKILENLRIASTLRFSVLKRDRKITQAHAWLSVQEDLHFYRIPGFLDL